MRRGKPDSKQDGMSAATRSSSMIAPVTMDPLDIHITSNTGAVNLCTLANANGYNGNPVQAIMVDSGVTADPIILGTWPRDFKPTLVNLGTISVVHGAPVPPVAPRSIVRRASPRWTTPTA